MVRFFVSYSRVDNEDGFVKEFVETIGSVRRNDIIWWDEELRGGDVWWNEIINAVNACDIFIYLLSNESVASPYCQAEYTEARRLQKLILTVQVRGRTNIPEELTDIQYVDMTKGVDDGRAVKKLFAALESLEERIPKRRPRPLWAEPTPRPRIPTIREEKAAAPPTEDAPLPDVPQARAAQQQTPKPVATKARSSYVGLAVVITLLVIGLITFIVFPLAQRANDTAATQAALALTPSPTETPSITPTPENTPTPMPTLRIDEIVGTMDAQATIDQPTIDFNNTAAARLTSYFAGTQSAFEQTSTATLWTATPTPNITASIDAFRTQQAVTATAQHIANLTATATLWTATPTITPTLPPVTLAATPVSSNAEWTPYSARFIGVDMVLVPAGCFTIGDLNGESDEMPTTEVCFVEPFWIDQYEVTNTQFTQFNGVAANGGRWLGGNRPRESITWFEAYDFCDLRGARLPTEAEWEYAARGPDNLTYPWGNTFFALNVVYSVNSSGQTEDVGTFGRGVSWVGASDMSGNVWEWVSTLYQPYPYPTNANNQANDTPRNNTLNETDDRVVRGGSWSSDADMLRAANRIGIRPQNWSSSTGFRCVRDVSP